jgi:hypothetical protein
MLILGCEMDGEADLPKTWEKDVGLLPTLQEMEIYRSVRCSRFSD